MFQPPKNDYTDYYDQAKFRLTWNLNVLLTIILLIITELFIVIEPRFVPHYAIGTLLTGVGLIIMRSNRRFEPTALISSILAFILVSSSIYLIDEAPHFIEPFWLLNITFYVFFVLGTRWGIGFLVATIVVVGVYLSFGFQENLSSVETFSVGRFVSMSIEFAVCMLLLGYIILQFIDANKVVGDKYKEVNKIVLEEKSQIDIQNKEKTVLLQEIHHRVKNNLQVITSLLRLQSGKVNSEESKVHFQDAINRIMTMASIHQKMYEEENLSEIDLEEYFSSLLSDLVNSATSNKEIEFDIEITKKRVGNKTIVPLALIITELVTNSVKHGFKQRTEGRIGLLIEKTTDNAFRLNYYDNGDWVDKKKENTLGLELIETFAEQLDGSFSFIRESSKSMYSFRFNEID